MAEAITGEYLNDKQSYQSTPDPKQLPPPRIPPPINHVLPNPPIVRPADISIPTAAPRTLAPVTKTSSTPITVGTHEHLDYENPIFFCKTTQPYFCFTPFSQNSFELDNSFWKTLEHYIQAQKFRGHPSKIKEIQNIGKPEQVAHYICDPENSRFINDEWNKAKRKHMYRGLYAKLAQNNDVYQELKDTGIKYLIYDTEDDKTWGIGNDKSGKNSLGILLCHLRLYFRSHTPPFDLTPSPKFDFDFMELPEHKLPASMAVGLTEARIPSDAYSPSNPTYPIVEGDTIFFGEPEKSFYEFSNYSNHGFQLEDIYWPTLNHYYQAQKFSLYPHMQKEISTLDSPDKAWSYARDHYTLTSRDFDRRKDSVVSRGLDAKFSQNNDLLDLLVSTDGKKLVYFCPDDAYWGIGLEEIGINRLGCLLSDIRMKLKRGGKMSQHNPTLMSSSALPTTFTPHRNDVYFFDPKKEYYEFTPNSQHPIFLKGKSWKTICHYFQCQKFQDRPAIEAQIEECNGVDKAWTIAHDVNNIPFIPANWDEMKDGIMYEAFEAKIEQHHDVLNKLKETGTKRLLFAAQDEHWGIGPGMKGANKIGNILMDIRKKYFSMMPLPMHAPTLSPHTPVHKSFPTKMDDNAIYFFKETSSYYPLTTFSPFKFHLDAKLWPTVNHYFQAQKFRGHPNIQEMIRQAETPILALDLSHDSSEYIISDWNEQRNEVMRLALEVRFDQHPTLKEMLMKTGNRTLVFNNNKDTYWGIGDGTGKNRLGKILVKIREKFFNTPYPDVTPSKRIHSPSEVPIPNWSLHELVKPDRYSVDKENHVILARNNRDVVIASICDPGIKFPISVCDDEESLYVICAPTLVKFNKRNGRKINEVSLTCDQNKVVYSEGNLSITDGGDRVKSCFTTDLNHHFK